MGCSSSGLIIGSREISREGLTSISQPHLDSCQGLSSVALFSWILDTYQRIRNSESLCRSSPTSLPMKLLKKQQPSVTEPRNARNADWLKNTVVHLRDKKEEGENLLLLAKDVMYFFAKKKLLNEVTFTCLHQGSSMH